MALIRTAAVLAAFTYGSAVRTAYPQSPATAAPQAVAKKPAPSFQAANMQHNIAPSGYSDGASEGEARQVASLVVALQQAMDRQQLSGNEPVACQRQAELLHAALTQPDSFQANQSLGLFYLQHNNPSLGSKYLRIAREKRPADISVAHQLLVAEVENQRYDSAQTLATALIKQDPSDATAHRLSGFIEAATGHSESAMAEYKRSFALDPGPDNAFAVGLSMLALGNFADAESVFATAVARYPKAAMLWLGTSIVALLQPDQARNRPIDALIRAAALDPNQPLAPTLLAALTADGEDHARVLRVVQAFAAAHPGEAVAHYDDAVALSQQGHLLADSRIRNQVALELRAALQLAPHFAAAHFLLGLAADRGSDNVAAIAQFQQALALEPDVAEWRYRLARAYRSAGQNNLAAEELARFKQLEAKRSAGVDVSARLLQGLPPELLGIESAPCDSGSTQSSP